MGSHLEMKINFGFVAQNLRKVRFYWYIPLLFDRLFIVDRIPWIQRFLKMDRLYSRYAEVNAVLRDQLRLHDTKTDNSPKALINRFRNDRGLDIESK